MVLTIVTLLRRITDAVQKQENNSGIKNYHEVAKTISTQASLPFHLSSHAADAMV